MRRGWIVLGWTVALTFFAGGLGAGAQAEPGLVERLLGSSVAPGQPDWDALHKLIVQSFPDAKPFTSRNGGYYVWRVRSEDLVFQASNPPSADGDSSAGFFWFDAHGTPISGSGFATGHRTFYQDCSMVSVPGVSNYVIEASLSGLLTRPIKEDFGLDGYRPVLLRYANGNGSLLQNPYGTPGFACGPKPPAYVKPDVLQTLEGSNPLLQLEALTWLAGYHSNLTVDMKNVAHEPVVDSVRYWSISNDSGVAQAAGTLESSHVDWVAKAAKFFVSSNKPQPVPNLVLEPRLKSLRMTEIRIGKGGAFDDRNRTVMPGDRVVIDYQVKLPNGDVAFTNYLKDVNPPVFQVGSDQVIEGLSKGLIGMRAGGARTIDIPASMAFGDAGADLVPPGADLSYRVRLLHIATEPPFGEATERVIRLKDVVVGTGERVPAGATVNVTCSVYRLDGRALNIPEFTGIKEMVLFTGSPLKKALIGMQPGGRRRLLVNFPNVFGLDQGWFHYGAQILEVTLNSIVAKS